jgi:hypothetical protein
MAKKTKKKTPKKKTPTAAAIGAAAANGATTTAATSTSDSFIPIISPSPVLDLKKVYANPTEMILEYQDLIKKTIPSFENELTELKEKMNIFVFQIETPKEENKKKFLKLIDAVEKMHFKISLLFHTQFGKLEKKMEGDKKSIRLLEKEKLDNVLPPFNVFITFVENEVKDFLTRHINDVKNFYASASSLKSEFTKWLRASVFDPIRDVVRLFYFGDNPRDKFVRLAEDPMDLEYPDINFIDPKAYVRYYGFVSQTELLKASTISFEEFEQNYKVKKEVKFSYDRVKDDDKLNEEKDNERKLAAGEELKKKLKQKTRKKQIRFNDLQNKFEKLKEDTYGVEETKANDPFSKEEDHDVDDDYSLAGKKSIAGGDPDDDQEEEEQEDEQEEEGKEEKEEAKAEDLVNDLAVAEVAVEGLQDEINLNADLKGNIFQKYNHFNFTSAQVAKAITLITTREDELKRRVFRELRRRHLLHNEPDLKKLINDKPTFVLKVLTKSYADKKQKDIFHVPQRIFRFFREWALSEDKNEEDYFANLPLMIESINKLEDCPRKNTWIDNLTNKLHVSETIQELSQFVKEKSTTFLINEDIYLFLKFKELKIDLVSREFYYETDKHQKFIYVPTDRRADLIREFNQRPNVRGLGIYKVYLAICDEYIGITERDVRNALTVVAERKDDGDERKEEKEEKKDVLIDDDEVGGAGPAPYKADEKKPYKNEEIIDNFNTTRHYQLTKQTYKQINSPVLATSPNFKWALDLIDIGYYELEYRYLLTVIDIFSKRCWIEKMKLKNSLEMFYAFLRVLYRASTYPHQIMCDNGGEFQSYLKNFCECDESFKVFVQMQNFTEPNKLTLVEKPFIKVINTLSYSPRSNGLVENLNNTVRKLIRRMITRHENNKDWIQRKNILEIENVKNNMKNVSTKFSPDQLWTPQPYLKKENTELNLLDHVENELQQKARLRLKSRARRILSINPEFEIGDIVRVKLSTLNSKIRQAIKQGDKKNLNRAFSETLFKIKSKIESKKKQRNTMYTLDNALTGERLGRQVFSNSNKVLKDKTEANKQHYRRIFGDEILLVIPEDTTTEENKTKILENVKEKLLKDNNFRDNQTRKKGESVEKFTRRRQQTQNNFLRDLNWKVDPKSKTSERSLEYEDDEIKIKNEEEEEAKKKEKEEKEKHMMEKKLDNYEASKVSSLGT